MKEIKRINWEEYIEKETNIPDKEPEIRIPLNWVGLSPIETSLKLEGFEIELYSKVTIGTKLPENRRGVHMSRFVNLVISESHNENSHIIDFCEKLARSAIRYNSSDFSEINVHSRSVDTRLYNSHFSLIARTIINKKIVQNYHGIELQIITTCPCTQTYFRLSQHKDEIINKEYSNNKKLLNEVPIASHMQRAYLKILIPDNGSISSKEILEIVLKHHNIPKELLKRKDEHKLVEQSFNNPQFVEDVVRDSALLLLPLYERMIKTDEITIIVNSEESIHNHSIEASLIMNVDQLIKYLRSSTNNK